MTHWVAASRASLLGLPMTLSGPRQKGSKSSSQCSLSSSSNWWEGLSALAFKYHSHKLFEIDQEHEKAASDQADGNCSDVG
jgi:hypothetical protein